MSIANLLTSGVKKSQTLNIESLKFSAGTESDEMLFYSNTNAFVTFDANLDVFDAEIVPVVRFGRCGKMIIMTCPGIEGTSAGVPGTSFISSAIPDSFRPTVEVNTMIEGIKNDAADTVLPYRLKVETDGIITVFHQLGGSAFNAAEVTGVGGFTLAYMR